MHTLKTKQEIYLLQILGGGVKPNDANKFFIDRFKLLFDGESIEHIDALAISFIEANFLFFKSQNEPLSPSIFTLFTIQKSINKYKYILNIQII